MSRKHCTLEVGTRFNLLTVVGPCLRVPSPCKGHPGRTSFAYLCRCDCGVERVVIRGRLVAGTTKSCGCRRGDVAKLMGAKRRPTHGQSGKSSPYRSEYKAWLNINSRCTNPDDRRWPYYGGRGITVCERWRNSFEAFFEDMGPKASPDLTIERTDNDKGYSPDNCVWATRRSQSDNTRRNVHHELNGERKNQAEWGRVNGIKPCTISLRLKAGWSVEEAITKKTKHQKSPLIEYDGESHTLFGWSQITGIEYKALHSRFKRGWEVSRMLNTPTGKYQRKG